MKFGVFFPKDNEEHRTVLGAFAAGLDKLDCDLVLTTVDNYEECDIAVVFGVYKKAVPASRARGAIIQHHKEHNRPVVILEKGFVKREFYYSVGLNGLNGRGYYNNSRVSADRWHQLGVKLRPWRDGGDHILLAGQVPWDASVQHVDYVQWLTTIAHDIRKRTNRPIVFRPHPLAAEAVPSIIGTKRSTRTLEEDLKDAYAVVTFNSNTGVDALIEGIPVFSFDRGSMVWHESNRNIAMINKPWRPDRRRWAMSIAYTQWNLKEMEQGKPHQHLFNLQQRRQQA